MTNRLITIVFTFGKIKSATLLINAITLTKLSKFQSTRGADDVLVDKTFQSTGKRGIDP